MASRPRRDIGRLLGGAALLVLTFLAGGLAARIWLPSAAPVNGGANPWPTLVPPTALPPTAVAAPTPTATSAEANDVLPTLYIEIAPDDLAVIEAKRAEALETWILQASSDDFVNAVVRLGDDDPLPVDLRLKGDWGDHFSGDKWSFRIEVDGEGGLLGMHVLSIQDPSTRGYLNEWLFLQSLRDEDVLAVGYEFVHVVQNGRYMGIYAVEEGFSKELLESQGRRESVIVRYNEDLLWAYRSVFLDDEAVPPGVERFHVLDEFESGRVNADPALSAHRDAAIGRLRAWEAGELAASEVFDVEQAARFWALADVWGASHAVIWHNLRFYYNPITTLLEPIAFDCQPLYDGTVVDAASLPGRGEMLAYDDPYLQRAYLKYLQTYSSPAYLTRLQERYGHEFDRLRSALSVEFGDRRTADGREVLAAPWEALAQRQAALRDLLSPVQMTYAYRPSEAPTDTLTLDVANLMGFPVEVVELLVGDARLSVDRSWVSQEHEATLIDAEATGDALVLQPLPPEASSLSYARIRASDGTSWDPESGLVQLVTRLWGMTRTITQPVLSAYPPALSDGPLPEAPTVEQVLARHPYLRESDEFDATLTVAGGTHVVSGNLILPAGYGLHLEAGTVLRFGPDNYLLARGPLTFSGDEGGPIVLEPSEGWWRGVLVLNAGARSSWDHVTIRNTDVITLPGLGLTGGVTFYESPLRIAHSRFLGTRAEDALNMVRTRFELVDSQFADTASDALDADFCQGEIRRVSFTDIAADGIDVSGSHIEVRDVRMVRLGDKALSVGESSHASTQGVSVSEADFAVVSKDLSHVTVSDITATGIRIAAFAAYIKKPVYGPATLVAERVTLIGIPDDRIALVQTGSWVDVDGTRIWGSDIDVDALYEKWRD
ncbi:MAG: hypothetical protein ACP5HG_08385 [Anaerolineae bacterium]